MNCGPTQTPDDIDFPALKARYRQERDRRLRQEGRRQYVTADGGAPDARDVDPYLPVAARDPISEDLDVAILGAGWSGILAAYHLKRAGVGSIRNIDHAGDFGGVWYWNRYPGVQCDNDGYCYIPLLEETGWVPSKQFSDGFEIQEQFQRIATQSGLYEGALFHTVIRTLRWDAKIRRWRIGTDRGDDIRARFVIMAAGMLNRPKLPAVQGLEDFQGHMFHTARWDYDYTGGDRRNPLLDKLADKRVAILGTGATSVQAVPHLARHAKHLYVIQRTPTSVDERHNAPTDPQWVKSLQPGWQKARQANFHRGAIEGLLPGEGDQVCDIWTEINRNLQAKLDAQGWPQMTLASYLELRESEDHRVMERMRQRVGSVVRDKATAEALKPWYRQICKRPCSSNDYLQSFNRPNVTLLDVSATRGLQSVTAKGVVVDGALHEIDCLIFASGYEVTSDPARGWSVEAVEGRNGVSLFDHWADGYRTLHGMTTHGFPNLFFVAFLQGGFNATTTVTFGLQAQHIAYIIHEALERGATQVEATRQAQDDWVRHIRETAAIDIEKIARECTPSYFNAEGEETVRWYLGETYGPGFQAFDQLLQAWRAKGDLAGLALEADALEPAET
jgi:cation diffusion facilitator CzcD-associated flavoprotein CzcO